MFGSSRRAMRSSAWLLMLGVTMTTLACQTLPAKPVTELPASAKLHDPLPQVIKVEKLANGLDVVFIPQHEVPIATILVAVRSGAMVESGDYSGLSHLYEHMFFKGNDALPTQELYMKRVRELGMVFNGTTSSETVRYFFTLPKENVPQGLVFMRDALLTPRFETVEMTREIKVVLAEFDRAESGPQYPFFRAMMLEMFGDFGLRRFPIGKREAIQAATPERMRTLKSHYYTPGNSALIVVGDVDPEALMPSIRELYGAWPTAPDPFVAYPLPEVPPMTADKELVVERPFQNVWAQYVWQAPSLSTEAGRADSYAATVWAYLFNQRASAFNKRLKDSGLWDEASVEYEMQSRVALFYVGGQTAPERAKEALAALEAEVARLADLSSFSEADIESAKVNLATEALYDFQGSQSIANGLGWWWSVAGLPYRLSLIDKLRAVTRADIERVANTYLVGKPRLRAILVSPENRAKLGLPAPAPKADAPQVPAAAKGGTP